MVKADALKEFQQGVRVKGSSGLTLENLKEELEQKAREYGVDVTVVFDQVKSGGLLNSSTETGLVLYNTQHPNDYFKHCITLREQGIMKYVNFFYFGTSKLTDLDNKTQRRQEKASVTGLVSNLLGGGNKAKFAQEHAYYDVLHEVFNDVFS